MSLLSVRPRQSWGMFGSHLPACNKAVAGVPLARGGGSPPYYVITAASDMREEMIRKLKEVYGRITPRRINAPYGVIGLAFKKMVIRMLNCIGRVLHPTAKERIYTNQEGVTKTITMKGAVAFQYPLVKEEDNTPVCMVYNTDTVRDTRYMSHTKAGYLSLHVGWAGKHATKELAHRAVTWAIKGPAPAAMQYPVIMHSCNNKRCLNPMHLKWGENAENIK